MAETKVAPIASRLRASILQQAVEGKLVSQDPAEGTADELLERIREERAELVKQKKAKAPKGGESRIYRGADGSWYEQRGKGEPTCIDGEIPFDIPETWAWSRLGSIAEFGGGGTPDKSNPAFWGGNIPWASMKDIHGDYLDSTLDSITEAGLSSKHSISICNPGELIVSTRLIPGKSIISRIRTAINQDLKVIHVPQVRVGYLHAWFQSNLARFMRLGSGTTVPGIKLVHLSSSLFPIPPLAEQERIVARIDELMPLVDQLEIRERESDAVDSAFWKDLPQSILQEAVQGRLVPQDDDDEPADVFLEHIREKRAELVKQKKTKAPKGGESRIYRGAGSSWYEQRGKGEPVCIDDEIPFDIPESWAWARLNTVVNIVSARRVHKNDWRKAGVPFYRAREVVKLAQGKPLVDPIFIDEELFDRLSKSGVPMPGDLLVTGIGTIGTTYIVKDDDRFYYKDASVLCFENRYCMNPQYLQIIMKSDMMMKQILASSVGTTVATLTMKNAANYVIPIPPIAEQERIVARIDELMSLVDELEIRERAIL